MFWAVTIQCKSSSQNTSQRAMTDIDKKASNEVKVGVKYKGVIEGRAAKADRNLGEFGGLCYKSHYGHDKSRVK